MDRHRGGSPRLDGLVDGIKGDQSILAAMLCGSLSHDTVWAKSDIDLLLITIDDKKVDSTTVALYADGVNVHAMLVPRAQFRAIVEGSAHNSFMHSLLAKGRLLYTHDTTIASLCAAG
jgi:predicted nucleotidyltransferase